MQPVVNNTTEDHGFPVFKKLVCLMMLLVNLLIGVTGAYAADVVVAVASNFLVAESDLAKAFERHTGHHVTTVSGSTGKLYAQITQGAPYDIFMAADAARPKKLAGLGLAVDESFFVYATGRLVLWSPAAASAEEAKAILANKRYKRLAMANPKTAPYGLAAEKTMQALGLPTQGTTVYGENISQCYQFVRTGHADAGFVALSQIISDQPKGAVWLVPASLYPPIYQGAVILNRGADNDAVQAWIDFMKGSEALAIIASYGYDISGGS